jgi:hypothetical protein
MSKPLDIIDELDKGLGFVRAASMALHGSSLDLNELNALDRIIGAAEDTLESVKAMLEKTSSTAANSEV